MRASPREWCVHAPIAALVASCAVLSLVGCGGGSDGTPEQPTAYVTGVAASGAAIANATVTMKDATGKSASAKTLTDGSFRVASNGLTPPYLLQVVAPGRNLYSVSSDSSTTATINVTTLTDLATRAWFAVNGSSSLDAVFGNPSGIAFPAATQVREVEELIDGVFILWLKDAGVDPATQNLISTPIKADGTGVDKVLGQTSVNGWVITISGPVKPAAGGVAGTTALAAAATVERTQVTTMSFDSGEKTVTVSSAVTAGEEAAQSVTTTVVPTSTAMETAFQQIDATIREIAQVAETKDQNLAVADVLPYLDPQHMGQGLNQQDFAELFVAQAKMSSGTLGGYLISLDQLDPTNGTAHGYYTFTETQGGQTATNRLESRFRLVGGKWLMSGDGRPGYMYVKAGTMTSETSQNIELEASADTLDGAYTAATVSGGPWSDTKLTLNDSTFVDEAGHRFRGFALRMGVDPTSLPAAGTAFTLKLQPPGGPQEQHVVKMNTATNAYVWITSAPGGTLAEVVGKTVTLGWALPATVVIEEVNLQGLVQANNGAVNCDVWGDALGTTATSGSITIPTTCDGQPVTALDLIVNVEGVNGEEISAIRSYK